MNVADAARPIQVLATSGSLRAGSRNTALITAAARLAGAQLSIRRWSALAQTPPFNADVADDPGPEVRRLWDEFGGADAWLIATPEYNAMMPGVLKNLLDWLSWPRCDGPVVGKPTAVVGASSTDYAARWAVQAARTVLAAAGACVVEPQLCIARANQAFDCGGALRRSGEVAAMQEVLDSVAEAVRRRRADVAECARLEADGPC